MRWWRKSRQRQDRRRRPRFRIEEPGLIVVPGMQEGRACEVRDISQDGAGLLLTCDVALPSEITLVMPSKELTARARIVWQAGSRAGFTFLARQ